MKPGFAGLFGVTVAFVNGWDARAFVRALAGTLLIAAVTWLVTAASDEGQLTMAIRTGRILPLVPLCSAVGVALAVGTARARSETRTLETLGRTPARSTFAAILGAAFPSLIVALLIATPARIDVTAFYPRAPRGETFVFHDDAFESRTLGARVSSEGELQLLPTATVSDDALLPRGARTVSALVTLLSSVGLVLVFAHASMRESYTDPRTVRSRRITAGVAATTSVIATILALQAAAARVLPTAVAVLPALLLLIFAATTHRRGYHAKTHLEPPPS